MIRNLGGVWAAYPSQPDSGLYFTQTCSQYQMAYLPLWPETSDQDSTITYCHVNGMWYYSGPHTENIKQY